MTKRVQQGATLHSLLARCQEGDVLKCVVGTTLCTSGKLYEVMSDSGDLVIYDDHKDIRNASVMARFVIESTVNTTAPEEQDTWGIGKSYRAPKKEYEPDTNIDGNKAFDLIKGLIR